MTKFIRLFQLIIGAVSARVAFHYDTMHRRSHCVTRLAGSKGSRPSSETPSRKIRRERFFGSYLFRGEETPASIPDARETGPATRGERDRRWETATETEWGRALSQAAAPSPAWQLVHPDSLPAASARANFDQTSQPSLRKTAGKRSKLSIESDRTRRKKISRRNRTDMLQVFSLTLFWRGFLSLSLNRYLIVLIFITSERTLSHLILQTTVEIVLDILSF